jgi:Hypothetical protein (DUF2513)
VTGTVTRTCQNPPADNVAYYSRGDHETRHGPGPRDPGWRWRRAQRDSRQQHFTVDGYDPDVIGHHVYLMKDGKLITGVDTTAYGSPIAVPVMITWAGHGFLDATRNEKVWAKLKAELKDRGLTLPFSLLQDLALKIAASYAGL